MVLRKSVVMLSVCFLIGIVAGCGRQGESFSEQSRGSIIQAQAYLEKSYTAFDEQNYIVAIDDVENALKILRSTQDPLVLKSNTYAVVYKNLIICNNQLGVSFLKMKVLTEDTVKYIQQSLDLIRKLDEEAPEVKRNIDHMLKSSGGLAFYEADAYYYLGTIAVNLKDMVKAKECVVKLRSLGKNDWAAEVEEIIMAARGI